MRFSPGFLIQNTCGWGFHPVSSSKTCPSWSLDISPSWGPKKAPTLAPPPTPGTHSTITPTLAPILTPGTHYRWTMTCKQPIQCTTQVDKKELFDDSKPTSWTHHGAMYDDTHFIRYENPVDNPYKQDLLTILVCHQPLETLSTNTI